MATRSEQRRVWAVVGLFAAIVVVVELVLAGTNVPQWILCGAAFLTLIFALVRYRVLAPRRQKFHREE